MNVNERATGVSKKSDIDAKQYNVHCIHNKDTWSSKL